MKKIPFSIVLILFFSIVITGVFIYSYNSYTSNLDYQYESQASTKLLRINTAARSSADVSLANELRTLNALSETVQQKNIPYTSTEFQNFISNASVHSIDFKVLSNKESLLAYTDRVDNIDTYFTSLLAGETIVCTNSSDLYFIKPYVPDGQGISAFIHTFTFQDFSNAINLPANDYNCFTYLIDPTGKIIASNSSDVDHSNQLLTLANAQFYSGYNYEELKHSLLNRQNGFVHYCLYGEDAYAYYSPTSINDIYLLNIAPSSVLDQDAMEISFAAKKFMNNMFGIICFLITIVFFISAFYTMKVNKSRDSLLLEQQRYKIALSHSKDTIWEYDIKTDTLTKSDSSLGLYHGISTISDFRNTLINSNFLHPDDIGVFNAFCDFLLSSEPESSVELRAKTSEHEEYIWYELFGSKVFDSDKKPISVIGQTSNINDNKLEIEQLKKKNGQDNLTKLYNSITLREIVNQAISSLDSPVIIGCLFIDIDNFKELNSKLGLLFGDAVLIDVSTKLTRLFRSNDVIGRVGGDEFVVIIQDAPGISFIEEMANRTCHLFHDIYIGENSNLNLSCSIGVSLYPADSTTFDALFEKAEIALYHAKAQGGNRILFYNPDMNDLSQFESLLRKKKQDQEIDFHREDRSLVDASIIANAIEIMFDSREIDVSINMMLSLIGSYYNLNRIDIAEYEYSPKRISITHEWCSDNKYKLFDKVQHCLIEENEHFNLYLKNENGIIHFDDASIYTSQLEDPIEKLWSEYLTSFFQCGISDHGTYIGYICISICETPHTWSKNEIDSLSLLCKIIGSYLIRLRSMQKADYITQRDPLTNAYNFNTFLTVVNQQLIANPSMHYAMVYSDIFQFKLINDHYGYQAGDHILKSLSDIFRNAGIVNNMICRITGDKLLFYFRIRQWKT